ncbi:AAA family ATPase [Leucobacter massiliensis]|uniref:AAA family ATPase n=1 Tax=Leucobacter massiliensis TaxID=1686285 RepID=A0A2S9QRB1_9MICO|nr:AAA family ATPase [Leucobacter massiliensis]PRI12120.1 AAA family ATPase [Leucobacter massiliensis]
MTRIDDEAQARERERARRAADWQTDARRVRRVRVFRDAAIDETRWPATIPAVRAFLRVAGGEGWEFSPGVTFLVGENGSGKSTLLEGIAEAVGLPAEGGSTNGGRASAGIESPLGEWLRVEHGLASSRWGFFLRAETMHGYYSYLEDLAEFGSPDPSYHRMSHGESFNTILSEKLDPERFVTGLALLDEPEAGLSFTSLLSWLSALDRMRARGTQVICATHSPILTSLPGATILELGDWGIREAAWGELQLVDHHCRFLDAPERYLRHLLAE